jgi:hypothetical protein
MVKKIHVRCGKLFQGTEEKVLENHTIVVGTGVSDFLNHAIERFAHGARGRQQRVLVDASEDGTVKVQWSLDADRKNLTRC